MWMPMSPSRLDHIARPADRDDRGGEAIFEQQQRAHDPGGELADRRIAVGVGRAGHRQGRGKLRIAEAGERADDAGDQVGDQHGRAGVERGGVAGAHEDAGADDAADAEEDEVPGPERALELAGRGLFLDLLDALAHHDAREKARSCRSWPFVLPLIPLLACCARSLAAKSAGARHRNQRASIGPRPRPPKMWTWRCGTSWPPAAPTLASRR